jgi:DNA-binding XRE family transcriptional regulator
MSKQKNANEKLRHQRELRGWSQRKVATEIGTDEKRVSAWECGESVPGSYYQEKLCLLFGRNALELGFLSDTLASRHLKRGMAPVNNPPLFEESDGYFSFGKLKTTSIVLDGDGTEVYLPGNIRTHYDPVPAIFFEEVIQAKKQIQQEEEEKQQKGESSQWNGEKYHLSKIAISREPGHENMTLGLWLKPRDHYIGLATRRCLDNPDFRQKYLPEDWSTPVTGFSCSLGVDITVISSDGYALLTQRGQNQSVHQHRFNSSVSEGVSPSFDRSTTGRAPDLYRCACRGISEELGIHEPVDFSISDIHFLSFSVDTYYALYGMRGIVRVKKSAEEILRSWHNGVRDKMENKKLFTVPFTPQDICSFVFSHRPFAGGLVCLYHALVHEYGRVEVDKVISSQ